MQITDLNIKTEDGPKNLATICTIKDLTQIPEADKIVLASMNENGWKCVVKKDEFRVGDRIIYICIDSIVDDQNPYFEFLRGRNFRIWNARFKKVPSQGLIVPLSILEFYGQNPENFNIGDDLTAITKTLKYEKPLDISLNGEARGGLPSHLGFRKTDETNLLSCRSSVLSELLEREIYISTKRDGSSTSFVVNNGEFQACSRSLSMKEGNGYPWMAAEKFDIKNKLINLGGNWIVQGETTGPKFNGNRLGLSDIQFHVFNVFDIDKKQYLGLSEIKEFCQKVGLKMVDVILVEKFDAQKHTTDYFQQIANNVKYPNGAAGEGIVIRPTVPFYSYNLQKEWSAKVINQNYKE